MADNFPRPPLPSFETSNRGGVRRVWAIVGIVGGFLFYVIPGFFAIRSYRRWRAGTIARPIFAWTFAWIAVVSAALAGVAGIVLYDDLKKAVTNELINVDFREEVAPFNIGENSVASFDHPDGTYRITVKEASATASSVGEFIRTAYAVGVRVDVVEMTSDGTAVGAACLGPAEGGKGPAGYAFLVEPGGVFVLGRLNPSRRIDFLKQDTDERIETVKRVSIECLPKDIGPAFGGSTDVTVTGYANGLEVATTEDQDGYYTYVYAGLYVVAEQTGSEVRFERVSARVPDGEWMP